MTSRVLVVVLTAPTSSVAVTITVPVAWLAFSVPLRMSAGVVALTVAFSVAVSSFSTVLAVVAVPPLAVPVSVVVAGGVVTFTVTVCCSRNNV